MRRRSERSYSTSFGAGLSDGSRVYGAAAGSTTGAPPRACDLVNAFSRAQPDPTTTKMMKSARPIVRRVQSIVSPPSASPESLAPGLFFNLVSRLGPLHRQQRCQGEDGSKDSGTRRRRSSNCKEEYATRRRRNFPLLHDPKTGEKRGLGYRDGAQVSDSRSILGHRPSVVAAPEIHADHAHDGRSQTWSLGRGEPRGRVARSARQRTSVRLWTEVAQGVLPGGPRDPRCGPRRGGHSTQSPLARRCRAGGLTCPRRLA